MNHLFQSTKKSNVIGVFVLILSFSVFACKQSNKNDENISQKYDNYNYLISEKCAFAIALHFDIQKINKTNNSISFEDDTFNNVINKSISSQYTVLDTNNIPAFYVFNYANNGGWLILSGDTRHEPVLAFNTEGSFASDENIPGGLAIWLDKTIDNIEVLRENLYDNTANGIQAWYEFLHDYNLQSAIANLVPNSLNNPNNVIYCPYGYFQKGPLLPCTWGQGCSYNNQLGTCSDPSNCDKQVTGCVATATAQIMMYWKQPSTIWNFNLMPNFNGNTGVQAVMASIGNNVNMNYGCFESNASMQDSRKALVNDYFYSTAVHKNYSKSDMFADIISNRPGMLDGCRTQVNNRKKWWYFWKPKYRYENCHQWCYDGVAYWNECGKITYNLVHMNWGWHEVDGVTLISKNIDFNGWYNYNDWLIPNGRNYQYANNMVGNIHP